MKSPQMSVNQKRFCKQMIRNISKWSEFQEENQNISDSQMNVRISELIDIVKEYLETFNYLENCYCKADPQS